MSNNNYPPANRAGRQSGITPLYKPIGRGKAIAANDSAERFHSEYTGAPYSTSTPSGIRASAPTVPSRRHIDIHETMKGVLMRQEGRDDSTYDASKFPTYSQRLNLIGQNSQDTTESTNTTVVPGGSNAVDGTAINNDGAIIIPSMTSGGGLFGGPDSANPYQNAGNNAIRANTQESRPIGVNDVYLYFDSFNKETGSNPQNGLYIFDVRRTNGFETVKNVIELELFPFFLPKVETDPTYQPEYYYFRTAFLEITSISSRQLVKAANQTQNFHFELEIEDAGSAVIARPKNTVFIVTDPLIEVTQLAAQFKIVGRNASYPADVFTVTAVFPALLPPPGDRRLVTSVPHGLTIGANYAVFFTGYNSISGALNDIMNDPIGQIATVIDATTVELTATPGANAIGTTPTSTGTAPTATMFVGPMRVAFTMRFRTIKRVETNFITPV